MTTNELDADLAPPAEATEDVYDVVIVGGGPAGTAAAIYAARADLKTLVVDKGMRSGAMGWAGRIANYPGVPGEVSGLDLLHRMRTQADSFGARFVKEKVLSTDLTGEVKAVWTAQEVYHGRTVIIATGAMGHGRAIAGEEDLVGRGVSYCATCDGAFYHNRTVAVIGNSDEAVEEALFLTRFAGQVYLLSPTPDLKAALDLIQQANGHPKITIYPNTRLQEILGKDRVQGVRFSSLDDEHTLPVEGVFIYLQGRKPITDFLGGELPLSETGCLLVDETMHTAIPGVFAVGDVLCNHIKQAVISAAEGAIAATAVVRYQSGREKLRPDWS
ncbi:MAG: FAD-dependent oxidoreductase [Anaerolineae bacterium]|nr:FAD-dependent oxidoreductase [Anaerolineae bacterium]